MNTSPEMATFWRLFGATGYYRKHPFEAIGFAGTDAPGMGAGTPVSEPLAETLFRLVERAMDGLGPEPGNELFNPGGRLLGTIVLTPGPSIPNGLLPLREAPKAQQERCQGLAERPHFNKIVASLNANNVLQGKGPKNGCFAPFKTLLRPGEGRPKLCLGETYADHFCAPFGCVLGLSLLAILLVARGQLGRVRHLCCD